MASIRASAKALSVSARRALRLLRWRWRYRFGDRSDPANRFRPPPWALPASPMLPVDVPTVPLPPPRIYGNIVPAAVRQMPTTMPVPDLKLSVVDSVAIFRRHVFTSQAGDVLPESLWTAQRRGNAFGQHVRPPTRQDWAREMDDVFVMDSSWHGYGHRLLEMLPQLQLLDRAPAGIPIATSINSEAFKVMIGGYGVDPARIVPISNVLLARRAYFPQPPIDLDRYCHPAAQEGFQRVRAIGRDRATPSIERLFISRSGLSPKRQLLNQATVEAEFVSRGFTIYYPELHPVEDQVATISGAKMIAGLGGSGIHGAVFAEPGVSVLIVNSGSWFNAVDIFLHRGMRDLAYVFGVAVGGSTGGRLAPWQVDVEVVRAAIGKHFGL